MRWLRLSWLIWLLLPALGEPEASWVAAHRERLAILLGELDL